MSIHEIWFWLALGLALALALALRIPDDPERFHGFADDKDSSDDDDVLTAPYTPSSTYRERIPQSCDY
ncbi:hypothetical protein JCM24511_01623 [Saitozyma sp. JCM 24511]|nr:hypothetical protein JCM24511_01623 [Saitozyma sp. JCM 24511]